MGRSLLNPRLGPGRHPWHRESGSPGQALPPHPHRVSSPCRRPLPASDDPDGDGVRELPGRSVGDVAPDLPFLACEAGLGEEDDLGGGDTVERCCHTAPRRAPASPAQPHHAPCTLPGLMLIFSKPSLSSCCEHPRGRAHEEHEGTSVAPAISPQPEEATASRLASANPSHCPEQPHLEHSCTAGDQPPRPGTLPPSMVAPSHHLTWYPSITHPSTLLSPRMVPFNHPSWYPSITHPSTLPSHQGLSLHGL